MFPFDIPWKYQKTSAENREHSLIKLSDCYNMQIYSIGSRSFPWSKYNLAICLYWKKRLLLFNWLNHHRLRFSNILVDAIIVFKSIWNLSRYFNSGTKRTFGGWIFQTNKNNMAKFDFFYFVGYSKNFSSTRFEAFLEHLWWSLTSFSR